MRQIDLKNDLGSSQKGNTVEFWVELKALVKEIYLKGTLNLNPQF
jgi:hypothetical protein